MFFYKKKIGNKNKISWNQKVMFPQESKEQHDIIVLRAYMIIEISKNFFIEQIVLQNKHSADHVNKQNKGSWK